MPKLHHTITVALHVIPCFSSSQEGDDEAAERWMQQARDRKLECDNFDAEVP
jgi:hypothetical protein